MYNLLGVNEIKGIERIMGDEELFYSLVYDFALEFDQHKSKISDLIISGDLILASKLAHAIKGASSNLCIQDLSDAALNLELALKSSSSADDDIVLAFQSFDVAYDLFYTNLEKLKQINEHSKSSKISPDLAMADELLQLKEALRINSFEAIDIIKAIGLKDNTKLPNEFEELKGLVNSFDFEQALALLEKML